MKVAAIGDNCIDVYADLDCCYPTGNAVDVAVHLRRLGLETSFVGFTGTDHYGDWLVETLRDEGVNTDHLGRISGPTAIAELGLDGVECLHQRYHENIQALVKYTPDQIAFAASHDLVHSAPWAYLDDHLPEIKGSGALISYDYSDRHDRPDSIPSMPFVDYGFFSLRLESTEAERVLRQAVDHGITTAVATMGPAGSIAYNGHQFVRAPAQRAVDVVNTVGAGDSFIAAFLASVLRGRDLAECLDAGAHLAATVVSHFGPWDGIPLRNANGYEIRNWTNYTPQRT